MENSGGPGSDRHTMARGKKVPQSRLGCAAHASCLSLFSAWNSLHQEVRAMWLAYANRQRANICEIQEVDG